MHVRLVASLATLLLLTACQTTERGTDALVTAFGEAVFGQATALERKGRDPAEVRLKRWEGPLRLHIQGGATARQKKAIHNALDEFSELTGLPVLDAASPDEATLGVHLVAERRFVINGNEPADCAARTLADHTTHIVFGALVAMPNERFEDFCLDHELMHAFGFDGHTHRIVSVLSSVHGEKKLTHWDRVLVRTLYHPDIRPGMTREQAEQVARRVIGRVMETAVSDGR